MVAAQHNRNYLGIELNEEYASMARQRALQGETGIPVKEIRQGQKRLFE
jgi:DNA modification methylase